MARGFSFSVDGGGLLVAFCAAFAVGLSCSGKAHESKVVEVPSGGSGGVGGSHPGGSAGQGGEAEVADAGAGGMDAMAGSGGEGPLERVVCEPSPAIVEGDLELITLSMECLAADGDAYSPELTPDGRFISFDSDASDIVPGDPNGLYDVFLFDRQTRELELISRTVDENAPGPGFATSSVPSDDARFVAFIAHSYSLISDLAPEGMWIYVRDRQLGITTLTPTHAYPCAFDVDLSGNGSILAALGYTNCQGGYDDGDRESVHEYELETGDFQEVFGPDGPDDGDNYSPSLSRDGRFLLFGHRPPLTRGYYTSELMILDRSTGESALAIDFVAFNFADTEISTSGDIIAFTDGQVYRYARGTDEFTAVSASPALEEGDGDSLELSMSNDGRFIAFASLATNLVEGDTNGVSDVFLYDAETGSVKRVSTAPDGSQADDESKSPSVSDDGSTVSFVSKARNLLAGADAGNWQVYVKTIEP